MIIFIGLNEKIILLSNGDINIIYTNIIMWIVSILILYLMICHKTKYKTVFI